MAEKRRTREELKREREQQKKKQQKPVGTWVKRILLTIVIIGVVGLVGGAGLFAVYASSAPELDEELLKDPVSSEFYDKNGEIFAKIGAENRKYVEYEDIPQGMVDAVLATEDSRFFKHFGIDIWRTGSAVIANFTQGFGSQGGSTITQQVVKNSFLSNDKKLKRKAQEAWLAIQLERQYEKEEIFEMYFNKILMSGRIYGIGTASEYFFGKEPSELELDEMALLAGIPQSPNRYNPYKNPERAQKRRDLVLDLMVQHKKITEEQAAEAKKIDVTSRLLAEEDREAVAGSKYDAFLDVVLDELEEKGDGEALAEGIKVYTTLDPKAQTAVEDIMNNSENFPTEGIQAGVSVLDTKTGQIIAIGGGRNYADRGYNFAHDLTKRSPGSTIKPLLDYGPAIENLNWSTGQTIVDEKMTYSGSKQVITNFDNKYLGTMTVRQALYQSRNVPAVKTLQEVGTEKAEEFINKLGIQPDGVYESDAIGGGKITMSPIQMSAAYAAFGNNGIYSDPTAIKEVVYRDGTKKSYKSKQVPAMSDYTAYMVTDILRDVVSSKPGASGTAAAVSGLDMAGKTGTTNYSKDEFEEYDLPSSSVPDSWFAGYTTNYSIAIWGGYSKRYEPITTWDERRLPQRLFKAIMSEISADVETAKFKKPSSVVEATIEVGTNPLKLASEYTPSELRQTELFVKGTEPTQISEEYEQVELNVPTNLQANLSADGSLVDLSWDYALPEEEDEEIDITFEVSMAVDNEKPVVVTSTPNKKISLSNIEAGRNYTFTVVAVSEDDRSEPASVSIFIENAVEEPEVESPEDPENGNGNGNGNNGNGNGNNGNNGNGNGGGSGDDDGDNEEDFEDWFGPGGNQGEVETPTEPTDPTETPE